MRSNIALFAALLVVAVSIRGTEAGYKRLNSYLIGKVDNDEVAPNMEAAIKWLREQQNVKQSFFSMSPLSDLNKFNALQQVIEDTKCDRSAHVIMEQNEEVVGLHRLIQDRQVNRRVDKVMFSIFEEHAKRCSLVYPVVFSQKVGQLDRSKFKYVKNLGQALMGKDRFYSTYYDFYQPWKLVDRYITNVPTFKSFFGRNILHDALKLNAENDPDSKYIGKVADEQTGRASMHRDKLKELVERYLIEPCQYYVDELGPDLFIPALFDGPVYKEVNNDEPDFYLGWSFYMICKTVAENKKFIEWDVIKSVKEAD